MKDSVASFCAGIEVFGQMMVRNTYQKPINAVNEIKGIEDSKNPKVKLFVMIAQLHHQNLT